GVARDGHGHVGVLDVRGREEACDRLDDEGRIHDGAVDDGFRGETLEAGPDELELALPPFLDLDQLHRGRADVEPDQVLGLAEQHGTVSLPLRSGDRVARLCPTLVTPGTVSCYCPPHPR